MLPSPPAGWRRLGSTPPMQNMVITAQVTPEGPPQSTWGTKRRN